MPENYQKELCFLVDFFLIIKFDNYSLNENSHLLLSAIEDHP